LFEQPRWSKWSALNLVAGAIWISQATPLGLVAGIPVWLVASLFMASGVSQLLWPGDNRITQTGALAGALGLLVSLPYAFVIGFDSFLILAGSALAATWGAGRMALALEPHFEDVPVPEPTFQLAAKVAVDEMILGFEQWGSTGYALDGTLERVIDEIDRTHARFEREGFLEKPDGYHLTPPDLVDPQIRYEQIAGHRVEMLRFESGYAPPDAEPGRERWLGYEPCRDGYAYVLRHQSRSDQPRPWLICTNGYRMGHARIDIGLFKRFYEQLGLNVLIPVLPLHGPRRIGWQSGSGFLGMDVVDTLHAEAQAVWDLRRLLSWARAQGASDVGAFGLSLGGYTTALFASVAEGLACAIPGIPLSDITRMLSRHASGHQMRYAEHKGYDLERAREILRVVSPLVLKPKVPLEGRMIFGATADRLVPPDHVRDLWRHWDEPEIVWYSGAHVSFGSERAVWSGVYRALRENGLSAA
jgi:dienelactone hydrolase